MRIMKSQDRGERARGIYCHCLSLFSQTLAQSANTNMLANVTHLDDHPLHFTKYSNLPCKLGKSAWAKRPRAHVYNHGLSQSTFQTFLGRLLRMHSASNTCPTVTPSIATVRTSAPLYLRPEKAEYFECLSSHGHRSSGHFHFSKINCAPP